MSCLNSPPDRFTGSLASLTLQFGRLWSVSCLGRRWRPVCVLSCLCHDTLAHRYQAPNTHCIALQAPARLANKPTHELPEISTAIQVRKHCLSNCMCNLFCVSADGAVDAMAASGTNCPSEGASTWLFGCFCNLFCVSADGAVDVVAASSTNQSSKRAFIWLFGYLCDLFCVSADRAVGAAVHWVPSGKRSTSTPRFKRKQSRIYHAHQLLQVCSDPL